MTESGVSGLFGCSAVAVALELEDTVDGQAVAGAFDAFQKTRPARVVDYEWALDYFRCRTRVLFYVGADTTALAELCRDRDLMLVRGLPTSFDPDAKEHHEFDVRGAAAAARAVLLTDGEHVYTVCPRTGGARGLVHPGTTPEDVEQLI